MSIIDSFHKNSKPMIDVSMCYSKKDVRFDVIIINFSYVIMDALIEDGLIELVYEDAIKSVSCLYPIYRFKGTNIGIVKTTVGAPITSVLCIELHFNFSCDKILLFGSCGTLDKTIKENALIVPTSAYRDEGVSYHYMPISDYIEINNHLVVSNILDALNVSYVKGKTWTTDAFYRETKEEIELRKKEGCIVVEMEVSACQAVAKFHNFEFYTFLYRGDNLDSKEWEKGSLSLISADERLKILNVAFQIANELTKAK